MTKILMFLIYILAGCFTFAQTQQVEACNQLKVLGGVDFFPWSYAKPFPWTSIQGQWTVEGRANMIWRFKVIKQVEQIKQLDVQIFDTRQTCSKPIVKGKGFVSISEPNIVRLGVGQQLIKIALFSAEDLKMNPEVCGPDVLMANIIDLSQSYDDEMGNFNEFSTAQMVLKKISNNLDIVCRKTTSH